MKQESYSEQMVRVSMETEWPKIITGFLKAWAFHRNDRPLLNRTMEKENVVRKHLQTVTTESLVLKYRKFHFN